MVLMAVSPAETSSHETLCTLRFSSLITQVHSQPTPPHPTPFSLGVDVVETQVLASGH